MIGETISHYKILEKLGGGGMGVVYKAEDTNLKRKVALKFLPPELTSDSDAKKRFMHEAQAASSLDHPNICSIFDIDEDDGRMFIAMSCYDGGSLKEKIAKGVLKIEEAIEIIIQVCMGLQKAHENGIVHRDIKPANIMMTSDGIVKIVDFGLAKLTGKSKLTKSNSTIGTAAYMSPEQTRSEVVDARSDIWSLGVMLYEMVTAHLPFRGEHEAALMYSILNEDPQPIEKFRQDVPMELVHIIRRALEKDVENRYQSLAELIIELRRLKRDTSRISTGMYVVSTKTKLTTKNIALIAAAAILFLAALYGIYKIILKPSGPLQATFAKQTDFAGTEEDPDISPDGKFILYNRYSDETKSTDIFLQRIGGGNPINLTKDSKELDGMGAFSPDGQSVAFHSDRGGSCGLYIMGLTGESVRRIADFGYSPSWSPDGTELIVSSQSVNPKERYSKGKSEMWAIQVSNGEKRKFNEEDAIRPSCSPHGYRIAFWAFRKEKGMQIWTTSYAGGEEVQVTTDSSINWSPEWSPDGNYLYYLSNRGGNMNIWRVAIDEKSGEVLGEPEAFTTPSSETVELRFSRNGKDMIYVNRETRFTAYKLELDSALGTAKGSPEPVVQGTKKMEFISPSPDGEWIVFNQKEPQEDIFIIRKDGSGIRQLTNDRFADGSPGWSPDGKRIAFVSNRSGKWEIWMINTDGSGLQQITDVPHENPVLPRWFPDGKRLAVMNYDNWSTRIADLSKPLPLRELQTLTCEDTLIKYLMSTSVSPDGNKLLGMISGGYSVYMYDMISQKLKQEIKVGMWASWFNDGWRILYGRSKSIFIYDMKTKKSKEIMKISSGSLRDFKITDGDKKIFYLTETVESDIWTATVK